MTAKKRRTSGKAERASEYNREGLQAYAEWDVEKAVERLSAATRAAPDEKSSSERLPSR